MSCGFLHVGSALEQDPNPRRTVDEPPLSSVRDPFSPPSRQLPPSSRTVRRSRKIVAIPVIIVLVAATAIGAWFIAKKYVRRPLGPLPYEVARLPDRLDSIERRSLNWRPEAKSDEYAVSRFAMLLCGGVDVYALLEREEEIYALEEAADAINDIENTRKAMRCAREIVSGTPSSYVIALGFDEVYVLPPHFANFPELPAAFIAQPDFLPLEQIRCRIGLKVESGKACGDRSFAVARIAGSELWVAGFLGAIRDVADAHREARNDLKDADGFTEVSRKIAGYEQTTILSGRHFVDYPLGYHYSDDVMKARKALEEKFPETVSAYGYGSEPKDDGPIELVVRVKVEADVKEVRSLLDDYRRAVKGSRPKAKEREEDDDDPTRAYSAAMDAMLRRAVGEASVTTDGMWVGLRVAPKADKDEQEKFDAFRKQHEEKSGARSKLVRSLIDGETPSDEALEEAGGRALRQLVKSRKKARTLDEHAPNPIGLPNIEGFPLPGAGEISGSEVTYGRDLDDVMEEFRHHLTEAGWSVQRMPFGAAYRCTRGDALVDVRFHRYKEKTYLRADKR